MSTPWLDRVVSHVDRMLETGTDVYGPERTSMWMSSLDTRTGRYPSDDRRPEGIPSRVYRNIDAPRGCTLYWDQPQVVAVHALGVLTGNGAYTRAADDYVRDFLKRCVAGNGIFLWGNHYYYDAFEDRLKKFVSDEKPRVIEAEDDPGDYHETRPIPPAWGLFWRVDPARTEKAIRVSADRHLVDAASGEFDRHASGRRGYAFLESGGILVHSLAWLYAMTGDNGLLDRADNVVAYCGRGRGPTGLVRNQQTVDRWDRLHSTTECGLWALSLERAAALVPAERGKEWKRQARPAVEAWIGRGWDAAEGSYYGRLHVESGLADRSARSTDYQPGSHSGLWDPLFPTHDYPMAMAEVCLHYWRAGKSPLFFEAVVRWLSVVRRNLPARGGLGGYAEQYARVIHFLLEASLHPEFSEARPWAEEAAREALDRLGSEGIFRGHPGEDRYDAVDGVGYLLLVLLRLHTGGEPDLMGMHW
jgi:hypothetical protein